MSIILSPFSQFIFLLSLIKVYSSKMKPIEIPIYLNANLYLIQLIIGNHSEPFTLPIDLTYQATWIYPYDKDHFIKQSQSIIINNNNSVQIQSQDNETFYGREAQCPFSLINRHQLNLTINDFHFYLIDKDVTNLTNSRGALAFPFKYNNSRLSLLEQYYYKGFIDNLSFALIINQTHKYLYLGGIPDEYIANKTHSEINVYGKSHLWDLIIPSVTICLFGVDYSYTSDEKNGYAYIDIDDRQTLAPKAFMDFLFTEVFKREIDKGTCYVAMGSGHRQLSCHYEWIMLSGNITFTIDDYEYTMSMYHFWVCYDEFCFFHIVENANSNNWVLRENFLWDFLVLFDYEKKKVDLYSEKGANVKKLDITNKNNNNINKVTKLHLENIIIICDVTLFIGVLVLFLIRTRVNLLNNIKSN